MATIYKVGDYVILQDSEVDGREWVMEVSEFLVVGPASGKYQKVVDSEPVQVPHYPEPEDIKKVGEKLLYVMSIDSKEQKARG